MNLFTFDKVPVGAMFTVVSPRNKVRLDRDGNVIAHDDKKTRCVEVYDEMNPRTGKMWNNDGVYIKYCAHACHKLHDAKHKDHIFSVYTVCRLLSQRTGSIGAALAGREQLEVA